MILIGYVVGHPFVVEDGQYFPDKVLLYSGCRVSSPYNERKCGISPPPATYDAIQTDMVEKAKEAGSSPLLIVVGLVLYKLATIEIRNLLKSRGL